MKTLVIDRAKWLTGDKSESSFLLARRGEYSRAPNSDDFNVPIGGMMCCLGFAAKACGVASGAIEGRGNPSGVREIARAKWAKQMPWLWDVDGGDSYAGERLICANDNAKITPKVREKKIAAIFAKHGVTVKFVGKAKK